MSEDTKRPADPNELLKRMRAITADLWGEPADVAAEPKPKEEKPARVVVKRPEIGIDNLWMTADETIDWTDALAHEYPADGLTSIRLWSFYHKQAETVLSGDTRAYAEVLKKANPLGELTGFSEGITMRAPDPDRVEGHFNCRKEYMEDWPGPADLEMIQGRTWLIPSDEEQILCIDRNHSLHADPDGYLEEMDDLWMITVCRP